MSPSRNRSSGVKVIPTLVGIIIVLALIAIAGEIGARYYIGNKISEGFQAESARRGVVTQEEPSVRFGTSPVLPVLVTKNIAHVTVDTPSTLSIENAEALAGKPVVKGDPSAKIILDEVSAENPNDPVAKDARIEVTLSPELLQALANSKTGARITAVTPLPEENVFDVQFSSGAATSKLRPILDGGNLSVNLEGASVLGLNLDGLAQWIGANNGNVFSLSLGHGLAVEGATVTSEGLALVLHGTDLPLSTVSQLHFE
nr:LmeA family phospholipid-binding protein [Corynebacterium lactis]